MGDWISAEVNMPRCNEVVIAYDGLERPFPGACIDLDRSIWVNFEDIASSGTAFAIHERGVTHWMPLPPPPEDV